MMLLGVKGLSMNSGIKYVVSGICVRDVLICIDLLNVRQTTDALLFLWFRIYAHSVAVGSQMLQVRGRSTYFLGRC